MEKIIELSHGAGGLKMDSLIHAIQECYTYRQTSDNDVGMDALDDGAIVSVGSEDIVITMDGHTIDPLRFPGGDIGKLAACGTINDLVMMGAQPLALTVALVIEEGFPFDDLREYLVSLDQVCRNDGVAIIGGDTKIVPKGKIDKLMIVTTGIGKRISKERILDSNVQVGDSIIISGPIGMHGIALLSFREGLSFST
ncbi:MAG TPA: AIR synthase related protein, partial [Candidatus Hodarchaeales archaeon]|nr:AIR synthase related protein [Candidatus Hodarchaeales archaeon]